MWGGCAMDFFFKLKSGYEGMLSCKCLQSDYNNKCDQQNWWYVCCQINVFGYEGLAMEYIWLNKTPTQVWSLL
jgi:hypothetical protein